MKAHRNQEGSHVIIVLLIVAVLAVVGLVGYKVMSTKSDGGKELSTSEGSKNPNEPPLKIKHIGINLGSYDPTTGMAGDLKFTKTGLESYGNRIFFDYGAVAEANSAAQRRLNPQPTFIVPLGTKVRSLVDGVVVKIETLYSNDVSIMVADKKDSKWIYELEHVINPSVKEGDTVVAGQEVAEVSTHDSQYHPGFGLYEIGILHASESSSPPQHVCIFNYLDDSIKEKTLASIKRLYADWEMYMGDTSLYNEAANPVPGCQTLDPVEG